MDTNNAANSPANTDACGGEDSSDSRAQQQALADPYAIWEPNELAKFCAQMQGEMALLEKQDEYLVKVIAAKERELEDIEKEIGHQNQLLQQVDQQNHFINMCLENVGRNRDNLMKECFELTQTVAIKKQEMVDKKEIFDDLFAEMDDEIVKLQAHTERNRVEYANLPWAPEYDALCEQEEAIKGRIEAKEAELAQKLEICEKLESSLKSFMSDKEFFVELYAFAAKAWVKNQRLAKQTNIYNKISADFKRKTDELQQKIKAREVEKAEKLKLIQARFNASADSTSDLAGDQQQLPPANVLNATTQNGISRAGNGGLEDGQDLRQMLQERVQSPEGHEFPEQGFDRRQAAPFQESREGNVYRQNDMDVGDNEDAMGRDYAENVNGFGGYGGDQLENQEGDYYNQEMQDGSELGDAQMWENENAGYDMEYQPENGYEDQFAQARMDGEYYGMPPPDQFYSNGDYDRSGSPMHMQRREFEMPGMMNQRGFAAPQAMDRFGNPRAMAAGRVGVGDEFDQFGDFNHPAYNGGGATSPPRSEEGGNGGGGVDWLNRGGAQSPQQESECGDGPNAFPFPFDDNPQSPPDAAGDDGFHLRKPPPQPGAGKSGGGNRFFEFFGNGADDDDDVGPGAAFCSIFG